MTYRERIEGMPHAGYINDGYVWRIEAAGIGEEADTQIAELVEALECLTLVVGLTAFKYEGQRAPLQEAMDQARAALAKAGADE